MFRRRPIHTAAAALTGTSTIATPSHNFITTPSQIWITITSPTAHPFVNGHPWILRVPLEVDASPPPSSASWNAAGLIGHGVLHRSRTLLAPHGVSSSPSGNASTTAAIHGDAEPRGPYDVTIDEALLDKEDGSTKRATVRDLVCLLVDPDAGANIEAVSLRDFAAMAPKRQLRAVGNDQDGLSILLSSERYQSERDARALRLAGITTVGQWREQPDRIPLSAYSRGVLDTAYNALARSRQQSQKDLVVAWLTRTIQRAVAEELMAPRMLSSGVSGGHATAQTHGDSGAGAEAETAYTTTFSSPDKPVRGEMMKENETVRDAATAAPAVAEPRRRGPRQRPVASPADNAKAEATEDAVVESVEAADAERSEEIDTEMADLVAEAEAIMKDAPPAAAGVDAAQSRVRDASEEEVEEVIEEVEEVEEVPEEEAEVQDDAGGETAAAVAAATAPPDTTAQQKEKLARLAELMLKQFNTADGYLHPTNKAERKEQEQRGEILVLDEDTAQVDPLAMFSAYHAATVTEADPVGVRALKTIWTSYNKHQMALEEASNEAAVEFYKRESVNALLYGSVLMRALAREEPVVVLEGTSLPRYGFPLVSSDTRPFNAAVAAPSSLSSTVTDMTPAKVSAAMQAYKTLFSDKEKRYSPFRPAVDQNAGCSVVRLSGTTLHLHYTSARDHIMEEEVRLPFAEVLLGMLHLLRQKVLPRINVLHYHLIATKLADATTDTYSVLRATATLDLTNPFTKEEHAKLKALAAPLGMSEEMDEFRCIDDLVMEIEDNSGASVVHSLLHNREDLEATLTATLAQLLPEDIEGEAGGEKTAATAEEDVEEEEDAAADNDEESEVAVQPSARGKSHTQEKPQRHPAPPAVPTIRRTATSPPPAAKESVADEEAELEEAIYTQWQKQKEQQQQQHRARGIKTTPAARAAAAPEVEEVEAEEEEFEEEEEELKAPSPAATPTVARMTRSSAYQPRHPAPPAAASAAVASPSRRNAAPHTRTATVAADATEEEEFEEEEEYEEEEFEEEEEVEEEEVEVVTAPLLPRSPPGHRAVPVELAEEEEAPRRTTRAPPPHPQRGTRHQPPNSPVAAAAAAAAPSRARTQVQPVPRGATVEEDAGVEIEDEDVPPPLPQVRTRRGGARRHSARARVPVQLEEEAYSASLNERGDSELNDAVANEDQWFKKPKRRYVE
ncbi:hypothetical protein ABL78_3309 [Leptomonas seymouri]|uniref:Uncharacterized protein n=1 Tax=Leptomonas seymouri TaxID=5684 RepID=A0A0N1ILE1_LEPSE|nr:hypothetical protein ABL78_3309 [Leptomonas seymouri]|eukprot:KPI87600.1 hypothetical protein ABL78_3309 [Leptomonas seymouri]